MRPASSGSPAPRVVDLTAVPPALTGGAVAIGNFDGVHRGHQVVLGAALAAGRPALALTFEPHPRAFFAGAPLFRLTPPAMKARVMAAFGMDATVVARFDAQFAALSAEAFIDAVLVGALGVRHVVVGEDFSFGARRGGTVATLLAAGRARGFAVRVVEGVADEGRATISSSRIREHLAAGEVEPAAALLGYRYSVMAEVVHGDKRGRGLGFPTANQALPPETGLCHGIYAVRIRIDGRWRDGVASFGRRPTFDNGRVLLETFVFDFAGDLYGRTLPVTLVRFLRPEARFETTDALVAQMNADAAAARDALAGLAPLSPLDAALNFGADADAPGAAAQPAR